VRDLVNIDLELVSFHPEKIIVKKIILTIFLRYFNKLPSSINVLNSNHYPKLVAVGGL